jgi:hypothetical protein
VKKHLDPVDEIRAIRDKKAKELARARKKGVLLERLQQMHERAAKFLKPRKKAGSR